jgi:RNA-binding motif X-linked protein 2
VDHCRKYKQPGKKDENGDYQEPEEPSYNAMPPILDGEGSLLPMNPTAILMIA